MASDITTRERRWIVVTGENVHHITTAELAGLATTYKGPQDRD